MRMGNIFLQQKNQISDFSQFPEMCYKFVTLHLTEGTERKFGEGVELHYYLVKLFYVKYYFLLFIFLKIFHAKYGNFLSNFTFF